MARKTVIVLPGGMGSEIREASDPANKLIWVNLDALKKGDVRKMEVDIQVPVNPAGAGVACVAGSPLHDYYDEPLAQLQLQLSKEGWDVNGFGYDWRMSNFTEAQKVVDRIKANHIDEGPVVIVGHSQGGLVARAVWALMNATPSTNPIKRIICVGTPNGGLFNPLVMWGGSNLTRTLICTLSTVYAFMSHRFLSANTPKEIVNVSAGWRSLYEMMPWRTSPNSDQNANLAGLYDPGIYIRGNKLDRDLMRIAKDTWHPLFDSEAYIPPGGKLVCIAGRGRPTIESVGAYLKNDVDTVLLHMEDGDDSVTPTSAWMATSNNYSVDSNHVNLLATCINENMIHAMVSEVDSDTVTAIPDFIKVESQDRYSYKPPPGMPYIPGIKPLRQKRPRK